MKKINQCRECKYCKPLTRIGKGTGGVCRCMHPDKTGMNFTKTEFLTCHRFEAWRYREPEDKTKAGVLATNSEVQT